MHSTRSTRSSVLGKRGHYQQELASTVATPSVTRTCDLQLQTPDPTPNPKRARTSLGAVDGDSNKENVPPFDIKPVNVDDGSPPTLRRMATELMTPSRPRPGTRRHVSTPSIGVSVTPTTEISHLVISTPPPTPPTSLQPLHARARALLRSTCNNDSTKIAGRDKERATIHDFLVSFLHSSSKSSSDEVNSTSLYISGPPGTGKTALVNSVLRSVTTDGKIISINCMALKSVDALWERLLEELDDSKKRKTAGKGKKAKDKEAVEILLSSQCKKCVVILDELDHITPTSHALTSIFSLPNMTPATIRLIGIANTHTLTSSSSSTSSVMASTNVRTLHFPPYTPTQLLQILQSRLSALYEPDPSVEGTVTKDAIEFLPMLTLRLLTKKIASLTGDVRSLFEVLRGAIDLAVMSSSFSPVSPSPSLQTAGENRLDTPPASVSPTHILAALKAYTPSSTSRAVPVKTNSEIMAKVQNLGFQARLVLLSVLLAAKRLEVGLSLSPSALTSPSKKIPTSPIKRTTSLPNPAVDSRGVGIEVSQLHAFYTMVLTRGGSGVVDPVSRSEFGDLVGVLEGVGLVSLGGPSMSTASSTGKRTFGRSASFGGGAGFGGKGKAKASGDVRVVEGVRTDEVLRGLGVSVSLPKTSAGDVVDVREEEVRGIWEREKARLTRDMKNIEREKATATVAAGGFEGAVED